MDSNLKRKDIVKILKRRHGLKCQIYFCPSPYDFSDPDNFLTLDHILPEAAGGETTIENLAIAHLKCNQKKGDRVYLPDGTLPPRKKRAKKQRREKISICQTCYEGRLLGANEVCNSCGKEPMPKKYPRYLQRDLRECDHQTTFCWSCSLGFTERQNPIRLISTEKVSL